MTQQKSFSKGPSGTILVSHHYTSTTRVDLTTSGMSTWVSPTDPLKSTENYTSFQDLLWRDTLSGLTYKNVSQVILLPNPNNNPRTWTSTSKMQLRSFFLSKQTSAMFSNIQESHRTGQHQFNLSVNYWCFTVIGYVQVQQSQVNTDSFLSYTQWTRPTGLFLEGLSRMSSPSLVFPPNHSSDYTITVSQHVQTCQTWGFGGEYNKHKSNEAGVGAGYPVANPLKR